VQGAVEYLVTMHLLCSVNFVHAVTHSREVRGVPTGVRMGVLLPLAGGAWMEWFKYDSLSSDGVDLDWENISGFDLEVQLIAPSLRETIGNNNNPE